ncbi:reverse transcriptase domain-containing protein [Tanacetum coccineum]
MTTPRSTPFPTTTLRARVFTPFVIISDSDDEITTLPIRPAPPSPDRTPALYGYPLDSGDDSSDEDLKGKVAKNASNQRKWKGDRHESSSKNKGLKVIRAHAIGPSNKKVYAGKLPHYNKCKLHHNGPCYAKCRKYKEASHLARDYRGTTVLANQRTFTCFKCGEQGNYRFSKKATLEVKAFASLKCSDKPKSFRDVEEKCVEDSLAEQDECTFSTMHMLLTYLQTAATEQLPVVAGLLLPLDLLSESKQGRGIMLDINLFKEEKGYNPEIIHESQHRRFKPDEIALLDKEWRQRLPLHAQFKHYLRNYIWFCVKLEMLDRLVPKLKATDHGSGPREDATRIGSGGVVRRQVVDVLPLRRVNQAIYLLSSSLILCAHQHEQHGV